MHVRANCDISLSAELMCQFGASSRNKGHRRRSIRSILRNIAFLLLRYHAVVTFKLKSVVIIIFRDNISFLCQ